MNQAIGQSGQSMDSPRQETVLERLKGIEMRAGTSVVENASMFEWNENCIRLMAEQLGFELPSHPRDNPKIHGGGPC